MSNLGTPSGLKAESCSYGRIIARIEDLQPDEQLCARTILAWVSCSRQPRIQEIIQALMIHEGDSSLVERKILKSIGQICGPIVEFEGDCVRYVHFTARE